MPLLGAEKFNPHPGGDIRHVPTTDGNLYVHELKDYTVQESRSLHSDLESCQVQKPSNGLSLVGVTVRVRVRVKNSLEVFRPHSSSD